VKVDRDGLVEVSLEDEPEPWATSPRERPPWSGRAWGRVTASIAILLAVNVLVEGLRQGLEVARAGEATGLSGSLAGPFAEQWRTEAGGVLGVVGELLLLQGGPSGTGVVAARLDDGTVTWQGPPELGFCAVHDLGRGPGDLPLPLVVRREPQDVALVCDSYTGSPSGSQQRVEVLDPLTGRTVLDVPWTSSGGGGTYADGEGLIAYGIDLENRVIAARWSLVTGRQEWFVTVDDALAVPSLDAAEGLLVVTGQRQVAVDLRTGALVRAEGAEVDAGRAVVVLGPLDLPDGGTVVTERTADALFAVAVREPDGSLRLRRAGSLLLPAVEEPGARDVLLVSVDGGLVAVDSRSGRELWSVPAGWTRRASPGEATYRYPLASVADLVVVDGTGEPVAVDRRTGRLRWSSGLGLAAGPAPCDGFRIALVDTASPAVSMVVLGVTDGRQRWRRALPIDEPSQLIALPQGLLAQVTGSEVAVLAPARLTR